MGLRKKKLGERLGAGLVQLKGKEDSPQVFSILSGDVLSYDYHYDDIYNQLGKFMCFSEYDENGKMVKKADCCKKYKKRQDRVVLPVIHYEGKKKTYKKLADAKVKYLSITSYKYNDLCRQLDDAGIDFDDCNADILLRCEDEKRGKISFEVIDSEEGAFWRASENKEMQKMVKDALETWEDDVIATLPAEYSPEEFKRLIAEAEAESEAPDGVEEPDSDIPKKKKDKSSKAKVEKDLDDEFDDEDEDEKPRKKKSVKEQIEEEDFDNSDLDDEEEKPKKKKKVEEEDDDLEDDDEDLDDEDLDDEEEEAPKKKKKKKVEEDDEDEDDE